MNKPDLKRKRNKLIYEQYTEMYFTRMMREEAIFIELKEVFFLEVDTIYRIVLAMSKEAAKSQPELPLNLEEAK